MVLKYAKNGFPYREPPYSAAECEMMEARRRTPIGVSLPRPKPQSGPPGDTPVQNGLPNSIKPTET